MKQNKTQFIADNYIDIKGRINLTNAMDILCDRGMFVVEPWGDDNWRVYVRKDIKQVLEDVEKIIN